MANCAHCTAATAGVVLCNRCQKTVRRAMTNISAYHADLLGIGSRRTQNAGRRSGVSDPAGEAAVRTAMTDPDAPDIAAAETKAQLVGWARILLEDRPGAPQPADTVSSLATFLDRHVRTIATLAWAGDFITEILSLERRLRRIVSRGKGQWYAGVCSAMISPERPHDGTTCACACHNGANYPCDIVGGCGSEFEVTDVELCEKDLYATPGADYVRCPACSTRHSVSHRRNVLLAEARETTLPLKVIAHVCVSLLDEEPSVQKFLVRLKNWVARGDLIWTDHDAGVRQYLVGDVLDLVARHAADPKGWSKRVTAC